MFSFFRRPRQSSVVELTLGVEPVDDEHVFPHFLKGHLSAHVVEARSQEGPDGDPLVLVAVDGHAVGERLVVESLLLDDDLLLHGVLDGGSLEGVHQGELVFVEEGDELVHGEGGDVHAGLLDLKMEIAVPISSQSRHWTQERRRRTVQLTSCLVYAGKVSL